MATTFKPQRKQVNCYCDAYLNKKTGKPFPHRLDSLGCRELYNNTPVEDYRVQIVRDFDRTEARAING